MIRHATSEWFSWGKQRHHLEQSTARLLPVGHCPIQAGDVPDADVTIATWWETMEWIKDWPSEKGIKAYFVRGYELHGGDPERVRATYRMPAQKLVISTWLQRLMKDEYGDPNAVLVPNGLDWGVFGAPPRGKRSTPTVGLMYSANPIKGGEEAFWALHLVRRHIPELRIVVLTPHPLPRSFRRLANIDVLYRPDDAAIAAAYRKTDCWLLSSHTEGFGMPGLEAAACRCPVVATRCGGPADYVEEGRSGYLV
ncbi:MAG: glycosyltransferase family 4 protein, partial [Phycisphaerae bacterium]